MDPENKPKGPSPHYSLYQRECFRNGGEKGICEWQTNPYPLLN